MTKWEESDLRSCYFLPFCIEDEEEDCVNRIGGSGSVKYLPKGVNKEISQPHSGDAFGGS